MKILPVLALLLCASAFAHPGEQADRPKHRGPPPEALEACKGKAAGTAVEMTNRRGETIKGVCQMVLVREREERGR
ncbi:MAG: hypothetical protein V4631_04495 [Pseudomonadota bacterium]